MFEYSNPMKAYPHSMFSFVYDPTAGRPDQARL